MKEPALIGNEIGEIMKYETKRDLIICWKVTRSSPTVKLLAKTRLLGHWCFYQHGRQAA
jgi:hypothetical protein